MEEVQEFEIDEALEMIRDDFGAGKIDTETMEREIDLALRGRRNECLYLSPFLPPPKPTDAARSAIPPKRR